jgi:hypothetical protein
MVVLKALRMIAATMSGIVGAVVHTAMRTAEPRIDLKTGDAAPDFSLPDLAGHFVVVAWFPKAFTGG